MKHPKIRVRVESEPCYGTYMENGVECIVGDTVSSGDTVRAMYERGLFVYQFLTNHADPSRPSRIMRCSRRSEAEWLASTVDNGDLIVAAPVR